MKRYTRTALLGLIGGLTLCNLRAPAELEVSAGVEIHAKADFSAPLAPYGAWVEVGSYGRCWRPAGVAVGWRPYCEGRWVWTDCGWYWESAEPWAWACYHYGWWVEDPVNGWVWVPGVEWAPSWVCWRVGGGCIGWAPLPPPGWFVVRLPGPDLFVFVGNDRFCAPVHVGAVIASSPTIIRQTRVISHIQRETRAIDGSGSQRVVINRGPGVELVQKATGRTLASVPIREAASRTTTPSLAAKRNQPAPKPEREAPTAVQRPAELPSAASPWSAPHDPGRPAGNEHTGQAPPQGPGAAPGHYSPMGGGGDRSHGGEGHGHGESKDHH